METLLTTAGPINIFVLLLPQRRDILLSRITLRFQGQIRYRDRRIIRLRANKWVSPTCLIFTGACDF